MILCLQSQGFLYPKIDVDHSWICESEQYLEHRMECTGVQQNILEDWVLSGCPWELGFQLTLFTFSLEHVKQTEKVRALLY